MGRLFSLGWQKDAFPMLKGHLSPAERILSMRQKDVVYSQKRYFRRGRDGVCAAERLVNPVLKYDGRRCLLLFFEYVSRAFSYLNRWDFQKKYVSLQCNT